MSQPVQVVGAGVIGLCCAIRLAEAGHAVDVIGRDLPGDTTSAVAGAVWMPYRAEPADLVARWGRATLGELVRLASTDDGSGVLLREGVLLFREVPERPPWADSVEGFTELRTVRDPAPGYACGIALRVPILDVPRYLDQLVQRLRRAGGRILHQRLEALPPHGVVVNASGLAARELAGDTELYPVRGQTVVLDNPGLTRWFVDDAEDDGEMTYVLPRDTDVVVGGTATEHDWNRAPDNVLAERMLVRARRLVPELAGAQVRAHRVGLRPARSSIRLDSEARPDGAVVHCYGHGGAGFTLSWGCADDVLSLVEALGLAPG